MSRWERGLWATGMVLLAGLNLYQLGNVTHQVAPSGEAEIPDVPALSSSQTALPGLSDYERRRFERRGLSDPQREILQNLQEHPDLIPHEPVLGGTMFFVPDTTYLLSDRWVMATYEDGHIQGRALFSYQVSPEGEIIWTLLDSYKD